MNEAMKWQLALWLARLTLTVTFFFNVSCALAFILSPTAYMGGFEVSGVPGEVLVRGMGILFLMWNVTYPPAIWHPWRHRQMFAVILVQQVTGLAGETWMWLTLPPGHNPLAATGQRFILFDGGGLVAMSFTFAFLWIIGHTRKQLHRNQSRHPEDSGGHQEGRS